MNVSNCHISLMERLQSNSEKRWHISCIYMPLLKKPLTLKDETTGHIRLKNATHQAIYRTLPLLWLLFVEICLVGMLSRCNIPAKLTVLVLCWLVYFYSFIIFPLVGFFSWFFVLDGNFNPIFTFLGFAAESAFQ